MLLIATNLIEDLPWWSFVVPIFISGVFISFQNIKVPGFLIGFFAGFFVWSGSTIYFNLKFNGIILSKLGLLISANTVIILVAAGIVGGLLSGLALFSGINFLSKPHNPENTL